jgi:heptaprenyl diphosphate synthase
MLSSNNLKERHLAALLTLAVTVNILELAIPAPPFLPWLKPGLANSFTLAAIAMYGINGGLTITILRILIAGFLSGQPFTSILIGGSGGLASTLAMSSLYYIAARRNLVSLFGISMIGAIIHSSTQILIVNILFVQNTIIFWQFPLLGPASIVTGVLTASIAYKTIITLQNIEYPPLPELNFYSSSSTSILRFVSALTLATVLLFVDTLKFQIAITILLITLSLILRRRKLMLLLVKIIPLVFLTAGINLFTEPGIYIFSFGFITYSGAAKAALLSSRLLNIMAISIILVRAEDISWLLNTTGEKVSILLPSCRVGLRSLQNIPVITSIFRDKYQILKGIPLYKKPSAIYRYISNSIERLLKAF